MPGLPEILSPAPTAVAVLVALYAARCVTLRLLAPQHAPGARATSPMQRWVTAAAFALLLAALGVIGAPRLLSLQALQHFVLVLVVPPLLVVGTPAWLWRLAIGRGRRLALARALTRPPVAFLAAVMTLAAIQLATLLLLEAGDPLGHLARLGLVLSGTLLWWPIASPLPEVPHATYPARIGYLGGLALLVVLPGAVLTFSSVSAPGSYAEAAGLVPGLDPVMDASLAGAIAQLGGGALLWSCAAVLFHRWWTEQHTGAPDPLYWQDLEPEIRAAQASAFRDDDR